MRSCVVTLLLDGHSQYFWFRFVFDRVLLWLRAFVPSDLFFFCATFLCATTRATFSVFPSRKVVL